MRVRPGDTGEPMAALLADEIFGMHAAFEEKWGFAPTRLYLDKEARHTLRKSGQYLSGTRREHTRGELETGDFRVTIELKDPPPDQFLGMDIILSKIPGRLEVDG